MTDSVGTAVRCLSCGEAVLGMANRCWKCHASLGTHEEGRPRLRRRPVPAEWLGLRGSETNSAEPDSVADSTVSADAASDEGAESKRQTASPFAFVAETTGETCGAGELFGEGDPLGKHGGPSESPWWWTGMVVATALAIAVGGPWPGWGWVLAAAAAALAVVALRSRRARRAFVVLLFACALLSFHSARLASRAAGWLGRVSTGGAQPTAPNGPVELEPNN